MSGVRHPAWLYEAWAFLIWAYRRQPTVFQVSRQQRLASGTPASRRALITEFREGPEGLSREELASGTYPLACTSAVLVLLGIPGILSLLLMLPEVPGVPRLAVLVNPLLLLAIFALSGSWAAPRCGFRSLLAARLAGAPVDWNGPSLLRAAGAGVALGYLIALVDHWTRSLWQPSPAVSGIAEAWSPAGLLVGMFYGGVVEEIVFRWGLMSLVIWLLWKLSGRGYSAPSTPVIWIGAAVSAVVFAAGHLPALQLSGISLTPHLIARTVGLNTVVGLVFSGLFARGNLEAAMLAHIGFHVGVMIAAAALP